MQYTNYAGLTEGRCFRYGVAEDYKGNRKGKPKPPIFYALKQYLKQEGFKFACLEADDLVSYYSYTDELRPLSVHQIRMCCISVGMHYYRTSEFLHTSPDDAIKFLWKQVLMGDSTDHIPGLPGVGDKTY